MNSLTIIVPDEALLAEVAKCAQAQHLHFITKDNRAVLSPVIPEGWQVIRINDNPRTKAA